MIVNTKVDNAKRKEVLMNYIDTHSHLWSEEYLSKIEGLGSKGVEIARMMNATNSKEDLEYRFSLMEKAGVKRQVISATPQVPEYGSAEEALECAKMINDVYADVMKEYPDKFLCYGVVPLPYVDEAIEEAKRCINELGFVGVALNTYLHQDIPIGDERLTRFFEALNEIGAKIYIHPTGFGACSSMVNDFNLEWVVGAPIEDGLAILQLLKADVSKKYPNIKFHVAHLGGFLPFLIQRIEDNYEDWNAFKSSPMESINESFYFDTANFHGPALRCSVDSFGVEKFFMGSDFPYFKDEKYVRAVEYIKNSGLDEKEVDAILFNNAIEFFNIK